MENLDKSIKKEYDRWHAQLDAVDPYFSETTIGINDVLRAHFLIVDYFYREDEGLGGIGPKSLDLLHSALYRQFSGFEGTTKWSNNYEICATLLFGLIKNHAFHDANKRTAFLVSLYHLHKIGRCPSSPQKDFEYLTVKIADNQLSKYPRYQRFDNSENQEICFIADFFKRNTRNIDKHFYSVTYQQLLTILNRHGFSLSNPNKNFIDIVKIEEKRKFLGLIGAKTQHEHKIGQISFPGWKKQVGKGTMSEVRKATKLLAEKGFDSQTFYKGADSMQALIDEYRGPLERLSKK